MQRCACSGSTTKWPYQEAALCKRAARAALATHFYLQAARRDSARAESRAVQAPQIHYEFLAAALAQRERILRICEPIASTPTGPALLSVDISHVRTASHQSNETHGRILRRLTSWKHRSAEWRMSSDPILHTLSYLMAKSFYLQATRLEAANKQTLEELIPKFLQILLHAEPSALLFY